MNQFNVCKWNEADFRTPEGSALVTDAVNKFMSFPRKKRDKLALEQFTTRGDFPTDAYPSMEVLRRDVPADMGWTAIFKPLDFTAGNGAAGEAGFDVMAKGSGVVLAEVPVGQKAKVYQAQGDSIRVPFVLYGGGINYHRTLIQDGRWWDLDDTFLELRNAYYTMLASAHYALVDAIAATYNVAWQNPTPAALAATDYNYVASRDANTINAAVLQIITNANKWAGIGKDTPYVVLAPLALANRMKRALGIDTYGNRLVDFNVQLVTTENLAASNVFYVAPYQAAGRSGMRLDYEIEFSREVLAYAESAVAWSRFGAAILSEAVIARCATA